MVPIASTSSISTTIGGKSCPTPRAAIAGCSAKAGTSTAGAPARSRGSIPTTSPAVCLRAKRRPTAPSSASNRERDCRERLVALGHHVALRRQHHVHLGVALHADGMPVIVATLGEVVQLAIARGLKFLFRHGRGRAVDAIAWIAIANGVSIADQRR